MRNRILLLASVCLYYTGLIRLSNWLHRRTGERLVIVNYHRASGNLDRHLGYLRRHFRLRFLNDALEELYAPATDARSKKGRRLPLAVTFDDGYGDNYEVAYPLVRELQVPITIFLVSDYIGCGTAYWWMDRLISLAPVLRANFEDHTYRLDDLEGQKALGLALDARYRSIVKPEARREFLLSVGRMLSLPAPLISSINEAPAPMLTWEQVKEMQESPWVQFGGHTLHHPTLASLADTQEAIHEVNACRVLLREKLGQTVRVFAYPHGGIEHIGVEGALAVQRAGYPWAVTTLQGANTPKIHPHLIRRISAHSQMHWLLIALMTSGVWDFLSYFNSLLKQFEHRKVLKKMRLSIT